jgi:hypothetical protein
VAANGAGTVLGRALVAGATREQLADELVRTFGIGAQQAAADVARFVDQLAAQGLLSD